MAITSQPPLLTWNHTAQDISQLTEQAIDTYKSAMDDVAGLDAKDCDFQSVALEDANMRFTNLTGQLMCYKDVSPSQELRDASSKAESRIDIFKVEASMRLDVFNAKIAAEKNIKKSGLWDRLSSEEQRLVEKMILDGKRLGLALSEEKIAKMTALKKELSQVCSEYGQYCNEQNGSILFTEEELKGVPKEELAGYTKSAEGDNVVYTVTYRGLDIFSIFGYAENPETRKKASEGWQSRLAIELRQKIGNLLGYNTWADYVTEVRMAKTGKAVQDFLDDLIEKLNPVGTKNIEALLELKKKEHAEKGLPFDGKFYIWDHFYYKNKFIKQTLDLDTNLIKEYFPVSTVVPSVLSIYRDMLGLRFEEIKDASTWDPEVQTFFVWEKDSNDETGFVGYFYLDLYPRPGKYTHNSVWPLLSSYELPDKNWAGPVIAMVANLAKPTPERPALLRHQEVWTFFHEMGHIFHHLLSRTKFSRFHGLHTAHDFGEAPSQMLENWCWDSRVLEKLSSHYETQKPLSPELIQSLVKSRYAITGLFYLQQVFFSKFDLLVHIDPIYEDYTHLWNSLRKKIYLHEYDKETPGHAAFQHLMEGYDVGYYRFYAFLTVSSETIFKADPFDPAQGKRYRDIILRPGGSRDEMDFLQEFLGRPPNNEAFLRQILGTV
ncbi:metallopeptidase MepB [Gymnopilus junonius]|uniref:Metallopeptidase MepB n=1 Tax=Gymnopilus junonius TaxID=109634 RepID=A0A9P5NLG5_GYMJU|nr:metallopeptidase MepB [Gymnopilus junonius]